MTDALMLTWMAAIFLLGMGVGGMCIALLAAPRIRRANGVAEMARAEAAAWQQTALEGAHVWVQADEPKPFPASNSLAVQEWEAESRQARVAAEE